MNPYNDWSQALMYLRMCTVSNVHMWKHLVMHKCKNGYTEYTHTIHIYRQCLILTKVVLPMLAPVIVSSCDVLYLKINSKKTRLPAHLPPNFVPK